MSAALGRLVGFQPFEVAGVQVRESRRWSGVYRDISFTVEAHGYMLDVPSPIYCGYLYLWESAFTPEQWAAWWDDAPEVREFSPGGTKYLRHKQTGPQLDGMNGGTTLYEQLNERLPGQRVIKVGWDYNHIWDIEHGGPGDASTVVYDCKQAIDSLRADYAVKHRCDYCGKWQDQPIEVDRRCGACESTHSKEPQR